MKEQFEQGNVAKKESFTPSSKHEEVQEVFSRPIKEIPQDKEIIDRIDVGELLGDTDPKHWPKIIAEKLETNALNSYEYGEVSYKLSRKFLSGDAFGNLNNRQFQEKFFSGVTNELICSDFKRFLDNVYSIVHIIGIYSNRYFLNISNANVAQTETETNNEAAEVTQESISNISDEHLLDSINSSRVDLSLLSGDQLGEVLNRLFQTAGLDEYLVFDVISSKVSGSQFLKAFEHVAINYSHATTSKKGIFKMYSFWEGIAKTAETFGFSLFLESTLKMYSHPSVDPFLKMRFVIELNKWLIGNPGYGGLIVETLDLSSTEDYSNVVLLDLLYKQSRSDVKRGSAVVVDEIVARLEEKYEVSERNFFLQAQLENIKDKEKYAGGVGTYAPLYVGDEQYVIYDPYGTAYFSEKEDYALLSKLAQHTKPRTWGAQGIPEMLTPDRKNEEENFDFYDSSLFEEHEDFLTAGGEDFIDVAQKYNFHLLNDNDFLSLCQSDKPPSTQEIAEYLYMIQPEMRILLQESFGVDVSELSRAEQFHFLNYIKRTSVANTETMKHFTTLYGVTGMRTFLSLEQGDKSLGDKIVAFGQHEDVARRVFAYYGELLDSADSAEQLVREFIQSEENELDVIEQVRANILNRAQRDLVKAVQSDDVALIRGKLDTYTVGAKEYVALLQEVGTGNIENIKGGNLSNDDKTQMMTLLRSNYGTAYPHKEDTDFRKAVAESLEEHVDDPNTTFRILYDGAKIVSFNRFDTRTDTQTNREVTYFGSFNAAAPYSGVGGVMLERTIQEQLQGGHAMFAHCDPSQAISMKYIEDGFIATDVYDIAGKESFEIWRSDTSSESVSSKQMSIQKLLESKGTDIIVREQKENEAYHEIKSGRALTRFFMHEDKKYLVFETLPNELQSTFEDVHTTDAIATE